ncbi:MAG TPA: dTMP kinase [Actinomycetes bacterium]|nr:dTMP kinase [Actinomycetes bacterium]
MPEPTPALADPRGLLIAFEGGEGAGKSTQAKRLVGWLEAAGRETVLTFEPGDTELGQALRAMLLHLDGPDPSARAEALLYAADRAEHVTRVIRPALARGAVVVTDRFVDSSIAYQGAGRDLGADAVEALSTFATDGLRPDLTVLLDVAPQVGLHRFERPPDRLEAEPLAFHARVRDAFARLAAAEPARYLVVDASAEPDRVWEQVRDRVTELLAAREGSA